MIFASGFSWFTIVPALSDQALLGLVGLDTITFPAPVPEGTFLLVHTWLAAVLIISGALVARMSLEKAKRRAGVDAYFADDRLSVRTIAEVFVAGISSMMSDVLEKKDVKLFLPFIGGLFAYIVVNNLFGLFPGFLPPTDNMNTNLGLAIASFLVFMSVGLLRDPIGFVKHLMGPVLLLAPLMFVIESIGLLARPFSLGVRLTGNLYGDHTVFATFAGLVPIFIPVIFLGLAIVVSFIQAFVFSLLSTVYIGLSLPHHDDDH